MAEVTLLLLISLCAREAQAQGSSTLTQDLARLSELRKGKDTQLSMVDELGRQLLDKYSEPKDQGAIYYELTHIHAQTGLREPDRVIEYAKKSISITPRPSKPDSALRLLG